MNIQKLTVVKPDDLLGGMLQLAEEVGEDFASIREAYERAIKILNSELGEEKVESFLNAVDRRSKADIIFCGNLGYQANLKNFQDPVARTFMDEDFEEYLQWDVLEEMPERQAAEAEINDFCRLLGEKYENIYEDLMSYLITLELDFTKLSHYVGFLRFG